MSAREAVAQSHQHGAQLSSLVVVEPREQRVFGLMLSARGAVEVPLPGRGKRDNVTAAVHRVALARDEAVDFERVEQRHEDAGIDAHGLSELALAHRAVVVQKPKKVVLARLEVVGGESIAQAAHCLLAEQGQQQDRAGLELFENATGSCGLNHLSAHRVNTIARQIVDIYISLCIISYRPTSVRKDKSMKAFTLDNFDATPGLRADLPAPTPADNEVLVRVHASSVNPVDGAIAAGMLSSMVEHECPVVLGRDYAGVVEQVGSDVTRYGEGDEVYGFLPAANPTVHDGSWAELIVVPEDNSIARKPAGVELAVAGAAPLAGITAMSALDALDLSEGDTFLVVGANGGVGTFAVQLAVNAGATVIAPGLPEDEDYLRDLGVSEVLERDSDFAADVRERHLDGVDALLDLVSYTPEGFDAYAAALKPGGRGASTLSAAGDGPGRTNVGAVPSPENLERLGQLLEAGNFKVPIQSSYGLDQAGEALQALSTAHTQGKRAIQLT